MFFFSSFFLVLCDSGSGVSENQAACGVDYQGYNVGYLAVSA